MVSVLTSIEHGHFSLQKNLPQDEFNLEVDQNPFCTRGPVFRDMVTTLIWLLFLWHQQLNKYHIKLKQGVEVFTFGFTLH